MSDDKFKRPKGEPSHRIFLFASDKSATMSHTLSFTPRKKIFPPMPFAIGQRVRLKGNATREWKVWDVIPSASRGAWVVKLLWPDDRISMIQPEALEPIPTEEPKP